MVIFKSLKKSSLYVFKKALNIGSETKKTGVLWSMNESSDDNLAVRKDKEEEWGREGERGGKCKVRGLRICAMKALVVLSCSCAHT